MTGKRYVPLLLKMLDVVLGNECPRCGASGDLIVHENGSSHCLACLMDGAIAEMERMGTNKENIEEVNRFGVVWPEKRIDG